MAGVAKSRASQTMSHDVIRHGNAEGIAFCDDYARRKLFVFTWR